MALRMYAALLVGLAAVVAGCEAPVPVHHAALPKVRYTRSVMKPDGQKIYSSNYIDDRPGTGFKPGSEAQIIQYSEIRVDINVNKIPHQMFPVGGRFSNDPEQFFTKYFVDKKEDIAGDKMEPAIKSNVENGIAAIGMSKAEVYAALGPPPEVNFGNSAVRMSRDDILQANRWIYFTNAITPFWFQRVYVFDGEKLVQVIQ